MCVHTCVRACLRARVCVRVVVFVCVRRQWTWLDEVGRNELLVLSTEEVRCSSPPVPIRPSSLRTPLGVAPRSPCRRPRHTHAPVLAPPRRRSRR